MLQRVMRRDDFCDVLLCLREGGPGGDKPGGRLAGAEHRLDRLAHLPRAEGGGEIGRLAASLCTMWPDPDRLAKEKEDALLPAGWTRRESFNYAPGERYFVNTKTNYVTWYARILAIMCACCWSCFLPLHRLGSDLTFMKFRSDGSHCRI